jgi:signal transduction histidine kinase
MPVELAEVAAGLPLAASFALAGGISTLREGRRRTALNEAMHELRRPLQVLALTLPADPGQVKAVDSSLRLAVDALDRLDREINGNTAVGQFTRLPLRSLLEEAVQRWTVQAALRGTNIQLCWSGSEVWLQGDRFALARAVDNLISNGFEHGGGEVTVEARPEGSWLLVSVRDAGGEGSRRSRLRHRPFGVDRRRHGHGLRVVARVARSHGGSFELRRSGCGAEARLRLPFYAAGERG